MTRPRYPRHTPTETLLSMVAVLVAVYGTAGIGLALLHLLFG